MTGSLFLSVNASKSHWLLLRPLKKKEEQEEKKKRKKKLFLWFLWLSNISSLLSLYSYTHTCLLRSILFWFPWKRKIKKILFTNVLWCLQFTEDPELSLEKSPSCTLTSLAGTSRCLLCRAFSLDAWTAQEGPWSASLALSGILSGLALPGPYLSGPWVSSSCHPAPARWSSLWDEAPVLFPYPLDLGVIRASRSSSL